MELRRDRRIRHRFGGLDGRVLARSVRHVWTTANASRTRGTQDNFSKDDRRQSVSATADHAEERTNPAARLGFQPGQVVQELGYDDDTEHELREAIEELTGTDLVDEEYDDVVDAVVVWFRDEDGDLADALVDATTLIEDGALIWLMTPKTGRDGYVEPSDIQEAAVTAGLQQVGSASAGKDWNGLRLATPKAKR
ncbi:DUF3052 domain-containing protein [Streptomyces stramineus]|uniref:DUF3052 domain-containing protein n=1 Tax=Streptomyces stramineus TaxID=173861 RepID=A0ABN0ZUF3_9ACTN